MGRHLSSLMRRNPDRYGPILDTPTDRKPVPYPAEWDDQGKYLDVIRNCPFKAGDVIWDMPLGGSEPVKALIVIVAPEWREHRGDNICRLKVARMTKAGKWAASYVSTYPGYVERAYQAAGALAAEA